VFVSNDDCFRAKSPADAFDRTIVVVCYDRCGVLKLKAITPPVGSNQFTLPEGAYNVSTHHGNTLALTR
jgi:hypothetical protein